jgi:hypothetical protein
MTNHGRIQPNQTNLYMMSDPHATPPGANSLVNGTSTDLSIAPEGKIFWEPQEAGLCAR